MRQVSLMFNFMLLFCIVMFYSGDNSVFAADESDHDGLSVDFGYMPPERQTAICLPDDPFKSIVDKKLLFAGDSSIDTVIKLRTN